MKNFAGYQLNIKYDPTMLEAIELETGSAIAKRTWPVTGGTVLQVILQKIRNQEIIYENSRLLFPPHYTQLFFLRVHSGSLRKADVADLGSELA